MFEDIYNYRLAIIERELYEKYNTEEMQHLVDEYKDSNDIAQFVIDEYKHVIETKIIERNING